MKQFVSWNSSSSVSVTCSRITMACSRLILDFPPLHSDYYDQIVGRRSLSPAIIAISKFRLEYCSKEFSPIL